MNGKISQAQLFWVLILSGVTDILSFSPAIADGSYNASLFAAVLPAFLWRIFLLVPVFILYKKGKNTDFAQGLGGGKGEKIISVIVIFLLTALACGDSLKFCYFTMVCPVPDISEVVLSLLVTAGAVYCALKGKEGLFRAGGIITAAVLAAVVFMFAIMLQNTSKTAFASVIYEFEGQNILSDSLKIIAGSSSLPIIVLLCCGAKGNAPKGFWWWNGTISFFALAIAVVTGSVLGVFGKKAPFPVYMAVNAASVGVLERFDALFICALTLGVIVRLGILLMLVKKFSNKSGGIVFALCAFAVFISGTAGRSIEAVKFFNNAAFRLCAIIAVCAGLPLVMLAKGGRKNEYD